MWSRIGTTAALTAFSALALGADSTSDSRKWVLFYDFYGDAQWSRLTGLGTAQLLRGGYRSGDQEVFLFLRNEYYDSSGSDQPFSFASRGTSLSVGARQWLPGRKWFVQGTVGRYIAGANRDKNDIRIGVAGFDEWRHKNNITDMYAEAFWVDVADDALGYLRVRSGPVLSSTPTSRLWAYGVGHLYATANGKNGTENRVEAGIGLGQLLDNRAWIIGELRVGYIYRGNADKRTYFNPVILIAVSF